MSMAAVERKLGNRTTGREAHMGRTLEELGRRVGRGSVLDLIRDGEVIYSIRGLLEMHFGFFLPCSIYVF
jgi:hypothetical protein